MASSSKVTIENASTFVLLGFNFEEATAGSIVTMPPTFVRNDSPTPVLCTSVFKTASSVSSLLGDIISALFEHWNEFLISPTAPRLSSTFPGVIFLDGTADPDFATALGENCHLKRTTLAFFVEIRIYHPVSNITPITVNSIVEPFEGELLFTPTHGELSMDSVVFDPHHYGFGAVIGFFAQSSDGHFLKIILRFNTWRELGGTRERSKLFVAGWIHRDDIELRPEDRRYLEEDSCILDRPEIKVAPPSAQYIVHIFP
ncbi:hypothetical protein CCMSSC00406_0006897 [Pleurotus cornucopiae]|uniref:Uncharacterized protein n=1 Tax=Pleurotus cornucopiae TaxID=5321 RepID=A0ACB7IR42_PLECO|nr:hypothetical protein CCMSSC00406_0006897 [Pleurotus cornucopiae]